MDQVVFKNPIVKTLPSFVVLLALAAAGIVLFLKDGTGLGLVACILGLLGALFLFVQMLPRANSLTLNNKEILIRAFFKEQRYQWNDIQKFEIAKIGLNKMVHFKLTSQFKTQSENDAAASGFMQNINGYDGALPSSYGMPPDKLCALLEKYRTESELG